MVTSAEATIADDARRAVLSLRDAGRDDELIELGSRYLEAVDADPQVALAVLKALLNAGLGGPARELLRRRRDLAGAEADAAALRRAVAGVPTGRVPWPELGGVFDANLPVLLAGRDHLAGLEAVLRAALRGAELFRSADGRLHLSRRAPGGSRAWVPSYLEPARAESVAIPLDAASPPVAVLGTGPAQLVQRVWAATQPAEPGRPGAVPLYVIDPDPARVAAWLHSADLAELLADPRVLVFAGPGALDQLESFAAAREDVPLPEAQVTPTWAEALGREVRRTAAEAAGRRARELAALAGRHGQRAAQRSAADWLARLKPGATVLGFASRATTMLQYSMRDIGHAFEALGYRFRLVTERADHCRHSALTTSRAVWDDDPALLVLINHFRREQPEALGGGPLLTWIQDPTDVVLSKETGASLGPLDFSCGYFRQRCVEEFGYPTQRFFQAPLPASERVFHDGPAGGGAGETCDVMYVGHLHHTPAEHVGAWLGATARALHPLLDRVRRAIEARHAAGAPLSAEGARRLAREANDALGRPAGEADLERIAGYFAFRLFDILFRLQTLGWVAGWAEGSGRRFRLYGTGWQRDERLAPFAAGPVEHGEPLRRAYRRARLSIQTMPGGFKHQRVFEALLSGSLVLGRRIPADFEPRGASLFFPELDRVVFRDAGELAAVAERFLDDAGLREACRADFARVVGEHFTYTGVVRSVLERIRGAGGGGEHGAA